MAAVSIPTMAPASAAAAADAVVVVLFESPSTVASVALPVSPPAATIVTFVSFPPFRYSPLVVSVSGALVGCGWVDCTEEQSRSGKSATMCVIRLLRAIFFWNKIGAASDFFLFFFFTRNNMCQCQRNAVMSH